MVVDRRSSAFGAVWRPPGAVAVRVLREHAGRHRVAWLMAKHTRRLVTRHLMGLGGRDPRMPNALAGAVGEAFDVELGPPGRGGGRALDAVVRA